MSKKANRRNLKRVLENLATMAAGNAEDCDAICDALNMMLDTLLDDDFFGTEGQLDPRGDHRD